MYLVRVRGRGRARARVRVEVMVVVVKGACVGVRDWVRVTVRGRVGVGLRRRRRG